MSEVLYKSAGTLHYSCSDDYGRKLWLRIDQAICDYYRTLVPKYVEIRPQMHPAHITVVRREVPPNLEPWGRHEGEKVEFFYSPVVHCNEVYFWLNCFCKRLEEVRAELGLPVSSRFTRPPDGYAKAFHSTIGNSKIVQEQPKKTKRGRK